MIITTPPILTVTQLNRQVRTWLEHDLGAVSVEGELSNLSKPASGHLYFTLKDAQAQIRCVYFRNRHDPKVIDTLRNGQQVVLKGSLSLYEARGDYQLIVNELHDLGEGDLYRQFELLKNKLSALGLFDAARKKPIPRFPKVVGIITSPTGAALRDMLSTLKRRYPIASIVIYPSDVQGKQAAPQLIQAVQRASEEKRCDVLILARGGGSLEDLWAFNDEQLAYAIANCSIPIVSGVGHETDFSMADFVADKRAETPTGAAEAATPDQQDLLKALQSLENQLLKSIERFIQHQQLLLDHSLQKMASPKQLISVHGQRLDYLKSHLEHAIRHLLTDIRQLVHLANRRLDAKNPSMLISQSKSKLQHLENSLQTQIGMKLNQLKQDFAAQLATLHAVSPLATLDRGYAIATHKKRVLLSSESLKSGDTVEVRLAKGGFSATLISPINL